MATVTKFANANAVILTGWTSPTNAYADEGSYATAAPAKNGTITSDFGFPAFSTADIPDGNTINSCTVEVQWKVSTTGSVDTLGVQLHNPSGTALGTEATETGATTADSLKTQQVTSGIALADLRSANVIVARVRAARGNTNTAYTASLDYVKLTVDYSPAPIVGTGAATLGATAQGGAGSVEVSGAASSTLGAVGGSAAGSVEVSGAATQTLGAVTGTGAGTVGAQGVSGSADVTLGAVSGAGAGSVQVSGASAAALNGVTAEAAASVSVQGSAGSTLGAAGGSGTGVVSVAGSSVVPLDEVGRSAAGSVAVSGSGGAALGAVVGGQGGGGPPEDPHVAARLKFLRIRLARRMKKFRPVDP